MAEDYILTAEGLQKAYGRGPARVDVLRGLSLSVRRGEFLAVMGPSGCGKTTLLHVLGLILPVDAGRLRVDGRDAPRGEAGRSALRRTHIGFVFQRFNLLNVLSAYDNVAVSLKVRGLPVDGRVDELFERMGVTHAARRRPAKLSIGEQQRVAVVRALAHRPAIVLADEPTGNLDSENSRALLDLLREQNRENGQTIVMITHSVAAAEAADRVVRMNDGVLLDNAD